jgi:hypothetical protein
LSRILILSNLSKVPIIDHLIGPSSVVDVEVQESFHESATRETCLPVVDIGDIVFVEVSIEHNIFKEFGAAARLANWPAISIKRLALQSL